MSLFIPKERPKTKPKNGSVAEVGDYWVGVLLARGEKVVMPTTHEPFGGIEGYVKNVKYPWAGCILDNADGSFDLFNDFVSYERVKSLDDIGLCDSYCWYEWLEKKHPMPTGNKEF